MAKDLNAQQQCDSMCLHASTTCRLPGCLTSRRREGEGEDVVLVGVYSDTDNTSTLVSCMFVLAVTVALRAVVKACCWAELKGMRLLPYRLMAAMMATTASADWLLTGAA